MLPNFVKIGQRVLATDRVNRFSIIRKNGLIGSVQVCCLRFGAVGSDGQINEVTLRRARLVLGWVTVSGSTPGAENASQSNQPPRSTQPGHPSVVRYNEYQPKIGDALRL